MKTEWLTLPLATNETVTFEDGAKIGVAVTAQGTNLAVQDGNATGSYAVVDIKNKLLVSLHFGPVAIGLRSCGGQDSYKKLIRRAGMFEPIFRGFHVLRNGQLSLSHSTQKHTYTYTAFDGPQVVSKGGYKYPRD